MKRATVRWVVAAGAILAVGLAYHFARYAYVSHSVFAQHFYVREDRFSGERCVFRSPPGMAERLGLPEC